MGMRSICGVLLLERTKPAVSGRRPKATRAKEEHVPVETTVRILLALAVRLDEVERRGEVRDDDDLLLPHVTQLGEHRAQDSELACERRPRFSEKDRGKQMQEESAPERAKSAASASCGKTSRSDSSKCPRPLSCTRVVDVVNTSRDTARENRPLRGRAHFDLLHDEARRRAELEHRREQRQTLLAVKAFEHRLDERRREDLAVQLELELGRANEDGVLDCGRACSRSSAGRCRGGRNTSRRRTLRRQMFLDDFVGAAEHAVALDRGERVRRLPASFLGFERRVGLASGENGCLKVCGCVGVSDRCARAQKRVATRRRTALEVGGVVEQARVDKVCGGPTVSRGRRARQAEKAVTHQASRRTRPACSGWACPRG